MRRLCLALLGVAWLSVLSACDDDAPAGAGEGTGGDSGGVGSLDSGVFNPVDGGDEADAVESETGGEDDTGTQVDAEEDGTAETLGRYEDCGFTGPSCEEPLQCVGTCQLPCTEGECPDGEDCIDLSGFGAGGICGHIVGEGEDCEASQALFCDEDLNCNEGTCEPPTVVGADEACGGFDTQCEEGTTCVFTGFGSGFCRPTCEEAVNCGEGETCSASGIGGGGACFEDCAPPDDTECADPNYECRAPIGGGDEACLPRFGGPAGERGFGEPCSNDDPCADGFFCPGLGGSYCTRSCGDATPCPEDAAGSQCQSFGFGGGVCAFMCPNGVDDCPEGMSCVDLFGQAVCSWQ